MQSRRKARAVAMLTLLLSITSLYLSGCNAGKPAGATRTPGTTPPSSLVTVPPTRTTLAVEGAMPATAATPTSGHGLSEASWKNFPIPDFGAVHAPLDPDDNRHLIFGNLQVLPPADDLSPELAAFLGRWEGSEILPEGYISSQAVFFVQQIDEQGGKAYLWAGEQLQYPFYVKEIRFRVAPGSPPSIEWQGDLTGGPGGKGLTGRFRFTYDPESKRLRGGISLPPDEKLVRPIEFWSGNAYHVYRNFLGFLQSKRITFHEFDDPEMQRYGSGYLAYLPDDYEDTNSPNWPLLVFLIGTGERGDNVYLLTKHGPVKEIMGGRSLPFIVVMPMLNVSPEFRSFPETYLDGLFEEILTEYRVDREKVYLTGISMGGEATYRYALHRPELFAALSPMSAFEARFFPAGQREGFKSSNLPFERLKEVPVWAVHGAEDGIVPLSAAQQTVDALTKAGVEVRFTVLEGLGHEAWTVVYADPQLYTWFLEHEK